MMMTLNDLTITRQIIFVVLFAAIVIQYSVTAQSYSADVESRARGEPGATLEFGGISMQEWWKLIDEVVKLKVSIMKYTVDLLKPIFNPDA